jgi:hypothetical protein
VKRAQLYRPEGNAVNSMVPCGDLRRTRFGGGLREPPPLTPALSPQGEGEIG